MADIRYRLDYGSFAKGEVQEDVPAHIARKLCEQSPFFAVYLDKVPESYRAQQMLAKELGIKANMSKDKLKEALEEELL